MNIWYTNTVDERARVRSHHAQQQADMRWCRLFRLYVSSDQPPPTTERGKDQLKEFLLLYNSLGCVHK
jgi:hypothetical protein